MKLKPIIAAVLLGMFASTSAVAESYTVKMLNNGDDGTYVFEPDYLHAQPGDTVTFKAVDAGHDSQTFYVPKGAEGWKGEISQDVTVTLDKEGVYLYECQPHHALGMLGVIQVGDKADMDAVKQAADGMEANVVMNKGRLSALVEKVVTP